MSGGMEWCSLQRDKNNAKESVETRKEKVAVLQALAEDMAKMKFFLRLEEERYAKLYKELYKERK